MLTSPFVFGALETDSFIILKSPGSANILADAEHNLKSEEMFSSHLGILKDGSNLLTVERPCLMEPAKSPSLLREDCQGPRAKGSPGLLE